MFVTEDSLAVDYANRKLAVRGLAERLSLRVRTEQFELFMRELRPIEHARVLDVGVSPDNDLLETNFFEKLYPHTAQITAASVEDASNLEHEFPGLRFVRLTERRLPFADKEFDVAFSSAVLEHVGDRTAQRLFLAELHRVARAVFVTTPNRWFPIELHTALPFLHWLPIARHQWFLKRLGHAQWASIESLNLMSARELARLFPPDAHPIVHRQRLFGLCSNLVAWSLGD